MVTRRTARWKGRCFEYDVEASLKQIYPNIYMTLERGYQRQYDLRDDNFRYVFECKFQRSISWNEAKKWFDKLFEVTPAYYTPFLIFKSNQQPVLVMFKDTEIEMYKMVEFEQWFTKFIKHEPIRKVKNDTMS